MNTQIQRAKINTLDKALAAENIEFNVEHPATWFIYKIRLWTYRSMKIMIKASP